MEGGVETGDGFLEGSAGGTDVQAHEASAAERSLKARRHCFVP